jgi:hypothetical protein
MNGSTYQKFHWITKMRIILGLSLALAAPSISMASPNSNWLEIRGKTFCAESGRSGGEWIFSEDGTAGFSAFNWGMPNPATFFRTVHGGTRRPDIFSIEEVDTSSGHVVQSVRYEYDRETQSIHFPFLIQGEVYSVGACRQQNTSLAFSIANKRFIWVVEEGKKVCWDDKTGNIVDNAFCGSPEIIR